MFQTAKRPRTLFKAAAVASAVLLVGGFVAYRAGAVDGLLGFSSTKTFKAFGPSDATGQQPAETTPDPAIMYSSKSGRIAPQPAPAKQPATTTMGGSKSLTIGGTSFVVDSPELKPAQPSAPDKSPRAEDAAKGNRK
jgi:hypothetical protein